MATDTFYVGGSLDDAHENGIEEFYVTETFVYVRSNIVTSSSNYICGGFRFPSVTIPQGSTVSAAKFSGYVFSDTYDLMNCKIYANNVDDAKNFDTDPTGDPHVISRTRTDGTGVTGDGYVSWVQDDVPVGWAEKDGLENVVQEVINRDGWNSNNALMLLFIGNNDVGKYLRFYSYDESSDYAAKLEVTWTSGAGGLSIPVAMHHYNTINKIIRG